MDLLTYFFYAFALLKAATKTLKLQRRNRRLIRHFIGKSNRNHRRTETTCLRIASFCSKILYLLQNRYRNSM